MRKLLYILLIFAMTVVLSGCETRVAQMGIVQAISNDGSCGYKYKVTVRNIHKEGLGTYDYTLWTDYNYHVGDTIKIQ